MSLLNPKDPLILDGAMGTYLFLLGVPQTACLEELNLTKPDFIRRVHQDYVQAGSQAVVTNTFGANHLRLQGHGRERQVAVVNQAAVRIAREAAPSRLVFGSVGPARSPQEKASFSERLSVYQEQIEVLVAEGVDGLMIETITSHEEARAALKAARNLFSKTIVASLSATGDFFTNQKTLQETIALLREEGADRIGVNCGLEAKDAFQAFEKLTQWDPGPFCLRPAGGQASPEDWAALCRSFLKQKDVWVGGCCETTPDHIRAITISFFYRATQK